MKTNLCAGTVQWTVELLYTQGIPTAGRTGIHFGPLDRRKTKKSFCSPFYFPLFQLFSFVFHKPHSQKPSRTPASIVINRRYRSATMLGSLARAARMGATRRVGAFSSATSTGIRSKSTASGPGVPPALLTNWYNM